MWLPLVTGVDGSVSGLLALDWAVDEASRLALPLTLVHACTEEPANQPGTTPPHTPAAHGESVVAAAKDRARQRNPQVRVSTEVVPEDAVTALLNRGRNASALVLGARGRGELHDLLLGSVSLTVAARAQCPVVVVRKTKAAPEGPQERIVVGIADAASSTAAVRFAFRLADARHCGLEAVMAREPPWRAADHLHGTTRSTGPDHHRALLDEALDEAARAHPAVAIRRCVVEGPAREVLLERSATTDLVVVGAEHRRSRVGLQLGRVSHALLHYAQCPVAVVPQWH
ncbi:universal stress protein [Streptomyces sp. NPDC057429]|uniref:universal stress protein n=1 Tax=Streptomyces sp. NPDC057429 TaxID=3346130 RepID=UPI00369B6E41